MSLLEFKFPVFRRKRLGVQGCLGYILKFEVSLSCMRASQLPLIQSKNEILNPIPHLKNIYVSQAAVVHTFKPSTEEAEAGGSL